MQLFIGLDGGGTACRAQAALGDGRCTQIFTGGPGNVFIDFDTAAHDIRNLLERALAAAHALASQTTNCAPHIVLGLAGVCEAGATERLRAALPYSHVSIYGDIETSVWGAFGDRDGIVMAVGTGSVLARQYCGTLQRLGGYGFMLGDEGSGAWIGREALRHALHAHDRVLRRGPLVEDLWDQFGTVAAMIGFAGQARPADYAALAPLVLAHDRASCPVAGAILDQGCGWLQRWLRQLLDSAPDTAVAALGGLGAALLDRMSAQGNMQLNRVAPKGTALDGALWKARQSAEQE